MKKSKFITGLSAAFVATMALMSCSSLIRGKDGIVLRIGDQEYTAEQLFGDQKTPAAAEAKFNAVYKVAVRAYFSDGKYKEEIEKNTKIKISEQKATAQSNADKNGTSYNEEWQKILDSNGVEDEQGLYDKFEYELQKEKFENNFYEDNYESLRNGQFPGLDPAAKDYKFKNYLVGKQPYHIKHILVKLSNAKAGDVTHTEITAQEARNLGTLIKSLADGVSFETLASSTYNEDETARKNKGSLGIMSRDTSFVNDFKLGIYMYESFYGSSTKTAGGTYEAKIAKNELGLNDATKGAGKFADEISKLNDPSTTDTATHGIGQIPFEAAEKLYEYADMDFKNDSIKNRFSRDGLSESDVGARYYPRNVIFNKYFNKHNIMVITPRKLHNYYGTTGQSGNVSDWVNTTDTRARTNKPDTYLGKAEPSYKELKGFKQTAKNEDNMIALTDEDKASDNSVLRDDNGRVILVFRSGTGDSSSNDAYQGIHFVVIERSPFIGLEIDDQSNPTKYRTTLNEYYTQYYPEQSTGSDEASKNHPTYNTYIPHPGPEEENEWKHTFVNYFSGMTSTELKGRADNVKDELKKCDSKLNTYLYQNLIKTGGIQFNEETEAKLHIKEDIDKWIEISRVTYESEQNKTWDETWEDYCWSLKNQNEQRIEDMNWERVYSKLTPEACVYSFLDDNYNKFIRDGQEVQLSLKALFGEGGIFHD